MKLFDSYEKAFVAACCIGGCVGLAAGVAATLLLCWLAMAVR